MIFDNLTTNKFKDKSVATAIIKIIEIFAIQNKEKSEEIKKFKSREGLILLLKDLANHVESYLLKKFSENFTILITEFPTYNLKYDTKHFMAMKYGTFDIIIFKVPFICLPSMFSRNPKNIIEKEQ